MTEAIRIEGLSVNYHQTAVLWDISCSLPAASLIGIIGPNGAGKSTLLNAIVGSVRPLPPGAVYIFGCPPREVRHRISYVPQRSSVDWDFPMTAFDLVLMGKYRPHKVFQWTTKKDKEAAHEALKLVEMDHLASRQIGELSGGQQQRLFIARALAQNTDILLLDEPFAGIDLATEKTLFSLFTKLKSEGKTIVMVHHDLLSVKSFFDFLVLLNTCLIAAGPTKEVLTSANLAKTYGHGATLLDEALTQTSGRL